MMLDALQVQGVPFAQRQQMAAKCLDSARRAASNPGHGALIRAQLHQLGTLQPTAGLAGLSLLYTLRLNVALALMSTAAHTMSTFSHACRLLGQRAIEKTRMLLRGKG
jgi:hypothetical protein